MQCTAHVKVVIFVVALNCLLAHILLFYLAKASVSDITSVLNLTRPLFQADQPGKQYVLLITYARSGSSFTSAIISKHPDVFFVSEPLFYLEEHTNTTNASNTNKTSNTPYFENKFENQSRRIIETFLTCKFTPEDVHTWDNRQMINSDDTLAFFLAFHKNDPLMVLKEYLTCIQECKGHRYTLVKTIRFKVRWVEWFLQHLPSLKVVYLVRDPRPTLYSQARLFQSFSWTADAYHVSKIHCRLLEDDLFHMERLIQLYPRRITSVRYEDIALNPIKYTKRIYAFLGLDHNDTVLDYVRDITEANVTNVESNAFIFGVKNTKSADAMDVWRSVAEFGTVGLIDRNCGHLYSRLGYRPVETERHLRSRVGLQVTPVPRGIFDSIDTTTSSKL